MAGDHSLISPSGLKRDLKCPGNVQLNKAVEDQSNIHTETGTAVHFLSEQCLKNENDSDIWLGEKVDTGVMEITITEELTDCAQVYIDYCRGIKSTDFAIESKLDLGFIMNGMKGTADFTTWEFMGKLDVVDLKAGVGTEYNAFENEQLMAYALGVIGPENPNMIEEVCLHIVQPRFKYGENITQWAISTKELYQWMNDVLIPGVKKALLPDAECIPGPWCKDTFCPAYKNNGCEAAVKNMFEPTGLDYDTALVPINPNHRLPDVTQMPAERLGRAGLITSVLRDWADRVDSEIQQRLIECSKDAPTNFKLVEGRKGNKVYKEGINVYDFVKTLIPRDKVFVPETFVTPAKLETNLKKQKVDKAVIEDVMTKLLAPRKEGKKIAVHVSDPRPGVNTADSMFEKGENDDNNNVSSPDSLS